MLVVLTFFQLSKEEEAASGAEDTEVRREDQDKINRFSRLHQRQSVLEEELNSKNVAKIFIANSALILTLL